MSDIKITSAFWREYQELITKEVLPYQWDVMNDAAEVEMMHEPGGNEELPESSHAIANLEIAAGLKDGRHSGYTFQDTDVYKWLEAAAYSLKYHPDAKLARITERLLDLIAEAQDDDGYLVTFFQIEAPDRKFARLKQSHELYTMGHYIEAAVAYYEVTGNEKALGIAVRMADCIDAHFGRDEDQIAGYDGHPEVELALVRLYEVTHDAKYLKLAKFFIDERGQDRFFDRQMEADGLDRDVIDGMRNFPLSYYQAEKPVREQETADGHAVRLVYLCTGMARVAHLTQDTELADACRTLWGNIVNKRMYVTGAIGSTNIGEAFTGDYDLPNDTMYGETCASVGLAFFAKEMLELDSKGEYADVLERVLFNSIISGMSLDGTHFFYVNPLQANPGICQHNPNRAHVLSRRADWFGCACCPSNVARMVASIDRYMYTMKENCILMHQFISNEATFDNGVKVSQTSNYPWDGAIQCEIQKEDSRIEKVGIRIPNWTEGHFTVVVDGKQESFVPEDGFVYVPLKEGKTVISLDLDMSVRQWQANPKVPYNFGKVALQRGPMVYCLEQTDHKADLWRYRLTNDSEFTYRFEEQLLNGVGVISANGERSCAPESEDLYHAYGDIVWEQDDLFFIPYYAWANREDGQMQVWTDHK